MTVEVEPPIEALETAIDHERANMNAACPYDLGYLAGLERAADIAVAQAHGLQSGAES